MSSRSIRRRGRRDALHIACEKGHVATAEVLLDMGADINTADGKGRSPLYAACWGGDADKRPQLDVARLLLDAARMSIKRRNDGTTALYIACEWPRRHGASVAREWGRG